MGKTNLTLVTCTYSGNQAVYWGGVLMADLGEKPDYRTELGYDTLDDVLEMLSEKVGFKYDSLSVMQPIDEGDWETDPDAFWPSRLDDVPRDERTYGPEDDIRTDGDDRGSAGPTTAWDRGQRDGLLSTA